MHTNSVCHAARIVIYCATIPASPLICPAYINIGFSFLKREEFCTSDTEKNSAGTQTQQPMGIQKHVFPGVLEAGVVDHIKCRLTRQKMKVNQSKLRISFAPA